MKYALIQVIVQLLNPLIGRWVSEKSGKQLTQEEVNQILSQKFPGWWEIPYAALVLIFILLSASTLFAAIWILTPLYNIYHQLPPETPSSASIVFAGLAVFFWSMPCANLMVFEIVCKVAPKRFLDYILMRQVKDGYRMNLKATADFIFSVSMICTIIVIPIILILFLI